ncbi:hypothetical protein FOZ62_014123 [Perkinsus olseni]|uniref:Uncharacterized protein n=1 Tax=Perkinsus olseni TaxID=32597 RepID=A0A7J6SZD7_PEROL|nr:hypothetical protein FOZ62_014123 [Perkinsus olseni]
MPISSLLNKSLPGRVEDLQLSDVNQFVTRRHIAVVAAWKREAYSTEWIKHAEKYDAILLMEGRPAAVEPKARRQQKSNMMRAVCRDFGRAADRHGYETDGFVDRLIYLFDFDICEALGEVVDPVSQAPAMPTLSCTTPKKPNPSYSGDAVTRPTRASGQSSEEVPTVAPSESYWNKRHDERLVGITSILLDISKTLSDGFDKLESAFITMVEQSRTASGITVDDVNLDGGAQVESQAGSESEEEDEEVEPVPSLEDQKALLKEERACRKKPKPKGKPKAKSHAPPRKRRK